MNILWVLSSLVFFISLAMVAASFFTPRTAIFFKVKTRARGALIWMLVLGASALASERVAPPKQVAPPATASAQLSNPPAAGAVLRPAHLPDFAVEVSDSIPGQRLALDGTLARPVDVETLRAIGKQAYKENKGSTYKRVYIIWYVPGYRKGAGAWGITHCIEGRWEVEIPALQGQG